MHLHLDHTGEMARVGGLDASRNRVVARLREVPQSCPRLKLSKTDPKEIMSLQRPGNHRNQRKSSAVAELKYSITLGRMFLFKSGLLWSLAVNPQIHHMPSTASALVSWVDGSANHHATVLDQHLAQVPSSTGRNSKILLHI